VDKDQVKKEQRKEVNRIKEAPYTDLEKHPYGPFRMSPYEHQKKAALIGATLDSSAFLMEQGTGKTLAALISTQIRWRREEVDRVLIIAPKSVLGVWEEAILETGVLAQYKILDGKIEDRKEMIEGPWKEWGFQTLIVNYDALIYLEQELLRWSPDLVILDESQKVKNVKAKRSKVCHRLGNRAQYRMILTGTPDPNSPLDYFSQYKFLDPTIFGKNYTRFQKHYAKWGGYGNYQVVRYKNQKELSKKVHSVAYRITLDEAVDLPEEIMQSRYCELEPQTRRLYDKIDKKGIIDFLGGEPSLAELQITALGKAQQIAGGFLKRDDGTVVHVGNEKLNAVEEFLEDYPKDKKVVIFARYKEEVKALSKLMKSMGRTSEIIWGGTKGKDRDVIRRKFQSEKDPAVLILQLQTGGLGITLTAASLGLFYSVGFSREDYDQAKRRLRRIGQKEKVTLVHFIAKDTYDEDVYMSIKYKESLSKLILDRMIKRGGEEMAKKKPTNDNLEYQQRLERLKQELEGKVETGPEPKPKKTKTKKGDVKVSKKEKQVSEVNEGINGDVITAKELADELGVTSQKLRAKLREEGIEKPSGRWEWPHDHPDLKKIRALYTGEEVEEEDEEEEVEEKDLSQMKKSELKELCKEQGIEVPKKASKEDLIELLESEEDEEDEEEEEDEDEEEGEDNYEDMKKSELKKLCEEADIDVPKKASKEDLIELLRAEDEEEEDEDEDEEDEEFEDEDEDEEFDYEDLNLKELKELCKEREIEIPKKAKKGKLVELLMEDDNEDDDE